MAHPMKGMARDNNPKWMGGLKKYADGGLITDPDAEKYDPTPRGGPAYSKGSQGALMEQMHYHQKVDEMDDPKNIRSVAPFSKARRPPTSPWPVPGKE